VLEAMTADYISNDPNAVSDFTKAWEQLTKVRLSVPLFEPAPDLTRFVNAERVWQEEMSKRWIFA
jgi:hypothetical protein